MRRSLLLLVLVMSVGCGAAAPPAIKQSRDASGDAPADRNAVAGGPPQANLAGKKEIAQAPPPANVDAVQRKIVYTADVRLIVTDMDKSQRDLRQLIKDNEVLIASSESTEPSGSQRTATWRLRVPVGRFDDFMAEVVKLGVPQRNRTDSEDITDKYYDLAERLKNKKREEETLRAYLQDKKTSSRLEDILKIETELSRVREEIEVMEGQLRRWANLSALATVTVTLEEIKNYTPPQTPTFGNQLQSTFLDSVDLLARFGRGLLLVVVAVAPWLVVPAVLGFVAWKIARRHWPRTVSRIEPTILEAVDAKEVDQG
jgi:Domain of unknown function (DUF4349)